MINSGKLLVHIAAHFNKERIKYLKRILDNLKTYNFSKIDIVVDTNSPETERSCEYHSIKGTIQYHIHKDLEHPFLLTWKHRENILQNINNYDFFMYTEDDILIPWEAVEKWYEDTLLLYPHGYIRGFLLVEKNSKDILMATYITKRIETSYIKNIAGHRYLLPPQPYHSCWIYTREQMMEFVHRRSWIDGNHHQWDVRERAAAGMMWSKPNRCRALIPISNDNKVLKEAFIYHLPNNFALDEGFAFAKIPANDIILNGWLGYLKGSIRIFLKHLYHKIQEGMKSMRMISSSKESFK